MQLYTPRSKNRSRPGREDGRGRFKEEERLFGACVFKLGYMVAITAEYLLACVSALFSSVTSCVYGVIAVRRGAREFGGGQGGGDGRFAIESLGISATYA